MKTVCRNVLILSVSCLVGMAACVAQADVIFWGPAQDITDVTPSANDVDLEGTLVGAINFEGSNQTVNGVYFNGYWKSVTGTGSIFVGGSVSLAQSGWEGGINKDATPITDAAYSEVVRGGWYDSGNDSTMTLTGLTPGQGYEIQLWNSDSRFYDASHRRSETVSIFSTPSPVLYHNIYDAASNPLGLNVGDNTQTVGQYVIGKFISDTSSMTISFTGANVPGWGTTQINAMQLREVSGVPEPGTIALLITGAIGLLAYAWRRRR